jgi:hypothetical protein
MPRKRGISSKQGASPLGSNPEGGSAMVLAIGVLAVLGFLALLVIAIVVAEKRTASAEYAYDRAFYSADAASEAGVHWLKGWQTPPPLVDTLNHVRVSPGVEALTADHLYEYDITYLGKQYRPGWSSEYMDYIYRLEATGSSEQQSQAELELNATRLYREVY